MIEQLIQDPTPWFSAQAANLFGGLGGALIGTLGAVLGVSCGLLIPRCKGRTILLGSMLALSVVGVLSLLVGAAALAVGQPYHVWYPLTLLGVLMAGMGFLIPVVRKRYDQAEQRRMDADVIRQG